MAKWWLEERSRKTNVCVQWRFLILEIMNFNKNTQWTNGVEKENDNSSRYKTPRYVRLRFRFVKIIWCNVFVRSTNNTHMTYFAISKYRTDFAALFFAQQPNKSRIPFSSMGKKQIFLILMNCLKWMNCSGANFMNEDEDEKHFSAENNGKNKFSIFIYYSFHSQKKQ